MRFPTFPTLLRTFHTVSNTTSAGRTLYNTPQRAIIYRSMPNIPFLGALFGSSSSMADNTNYPVQKTEGEWQTQLSPGAHTLIQSSPHPH
jgi:peptide-methionine (R)-S-oxide reductase